MSGKIDDFIESTTSPELIQTATALLPVLYEDLHRIARRERKRMWGSTLQTTALINEAYLKLRGAPEFNDRQHFLRASALAMRHILINYVRERRAEKRGRGAVVVSLDGIENAVVERDEALLLDVNDALRKLALLNVRLAQVVECRFFGGFADAEIAEALGITERTARRDWIKARAWLMHQLETRED